MTNLKMIEFNKDYITLGRELVYLMLRADDHKRYTPKLKKIFLDMYIKKEVDKYNITLLYSPVLYYIFNELPNKIYYNNLENRTNIFLERIKLVDISTFQNVVLINNILNTNGMYDFLIKIYKQLKVDNNSIIICGINANEFSYEEILCETIDHHKYYIPMDKKISKNKIIKIMKNKIYNIATYNITDHDILRFNLLTKNNYTTSEIYKYTKKVLLKIQHSPLYNIIPNDSIKNIYKMLQFLMEFNINNFKTDIVKEYNTITNLEMDTGKHEISNI